jgi:spore coat polysaccharide biosynthesis protein SpsF
MVLERLALVPADLRILATDAASATELAPLARDHGFEFVVGPAEDVLARYCLAIREFGLDRVLRATGDNPLVSHEAAALLIEGGAAATASYATFTGMPLGMGVELVSAAALLRAEAEAEDPAEREHVCPHLYRNPTRYAIEEFRAPDEYYLPSGRVTVDLEADYEKALRIYGAFYDGEPIPTARVMAYLRETDTAGKRKGP